MRALLPFALTTLAACSAPDPIAELPDGADPTLAKAIACLPKGAALTAAHRGTDRGSRLPENSLAALDALIERGIPIAEIDVAQTRDGVHILFHDDRWDDDSDGRGRVTDVDWTVARDFRLRDPQGRFTDETPVTFADYLATAEGRIFLEIDFKRSADYADVIEIIDDYGLIQDVVFIAYTPGQGRALRRLSPNALISVPLADIDAVAPPVLAWVDDDPIDPDVPAIARLSARSGDVFRNRELLAAAEIAVTDHALSERPIPGLKDEAAYTACLAGSG